MKLKTEKPVKTTTKVKPQFKAHQFRYFQTKIGNGFMGGFIKADFVNNKTWFVERETGIEEDFSDDLTANQCLFYVEEGSWFECTLERNRAQEYGYIGLIPADLKN